SVPVAARHKRAETAAADPPDEPPGVRSAFEPSLRFHGDMTLPKALVVFEEPMANSSMLSLPSMIAPSSNNFCVTVDSYWGLKPRNMLEQAADSTPRVQNKSLMPSGAPSRAPALPEARRSSLSLACFKAMSCVTVL